MLECQGYIKGREQFGKVFHLVKVCDEQAPRHCVLNKDKQQSAVRGKSGEQLRMATARCCDEKSLASAEGADKGCMPIVV